MFKDRHHILHDRVEWTARPQAKQLRETPQLVPEIPRSLHNEIHANVPSVPILGYHALSRTIKGFYPVRFDTVATIDNFSFAVEEAINHPRSYEIERSLGELTIAAVQMQKPFLAEYYDLQRRTVIDLGAVPTA